jgi:molybdopterin molybdochelatase
VADERDSDRRELVEAIDGFEVAVRAYESPARKVASGDADVGLGLRATAADLGVGFVPIGTQSVRVRANPDRTDKHGLAELEAAIAEADDLLEEMPGYRRS